MKSRLLLLLGLAGCAQTYVINFNVPMETPADLDAQLARFRSGEEKWRGDPKAVADQALRLKLDIHAAPWMASAFHPPAYEVKQSAEWGTYVVRGYQYPSGANARYRVKVRPYSEIWYPIEVSHYKEVILPHPATED